MLKVGDDVKFIMESEFDCVDIKTGTIGVVTELRTPTLVDVKFTTGDTMLCYSNQLKLINTNKELYNRIVILLKTGTTVHGKPYKVDHKAIKYWSTSMQEIVELNKLYDELSIANEKVERWWREVVK